MAPKTYVFENLSKNEVQYFNFKAENRTNSKYFNENPNISLRLPIDQAHELANDGWKINIWHPSEESIRRAAENGREAPVECGFMDITVDWPWSNSGTYPISIFLVEGVNQTPLNEESAKQLDDILPRMHFANIKIRGRAIKNDDGSIRYYKPCLVELDVYADEDIMAKRRDAYIEKLASMQSDVVGNGDLPFEL